MPSFPEIPSPKFPINNIKNPPNSPIANKSNDIRKAIKKR